MQTKIAAKKAAFIISLPKLRTKKGVNDLFEIQIGPFLIHENISEKTNYYNRSFPENLLDITWFYKIVNFGILTNLKTKFCFDKFIFPLNAIIFEYNIDCNASSV